MRKQKFLLFISAIILSIISWINYGRFVYITSIDPKLDIQAYDQKYFSNYPSFIAGIDKINIAIMIVIAVSIVLITASGYLSSSVKIFAWVVQAINIAIFTMLVMAYI